MSRPQRDPFDKPTEIERRRYNRMASVYDMNVVPLERLFGLYRWRKLLWSKVEGSRILEVGVGTGLSIPHYPDGAQITAIDISDNMLKRAGARARKRNVKVDLRLMDVQHLEFEDGVFDTVVASLVFCAVPDPLKGLGEVRRVVKAGGKVLLLEHVRSSSRILARFMDLMNPVTRWAGGENINRRTVENVERAGLKVENVTSFGHFRVFKLIEARKA